MQNGGRDEAKLNLFDKSRTTESVQGMIEEFSDKAKQSHVIYNSYQGE